MRNVLQVLQLVLILTFISCGKNNSVRHIPNLGDTPYQADSVLVTYAHHPDRALVMLDSALLLGNINEYRAQFIRAKIYSKSLLKQRQDSAILICLGQPEEGMAKIDEAIRQLDESGSIDRMDAFIIAVKRKITVLNNRGRHAEVIPLAQRILHRLEHYEQHAMDYAEDSYRLSWSDKPAVPRPTVSWLEPMP